MYIAALKCVYNTAHACKTHNSTLVQTRQVGVLQAILELKPPDNVEIDKMRLVALLTMRELVQGGYHMALLDPTVVNTLLRYV